jgi:hypothetical protein
MLIFLLQEEEHRMRKVALNISKDVKKFWIKIEKLASSFLSSNVIVNCDTTLDISFLKKTELYFASSFLSSNVMVNCDTTLDVSFLKKTELYFIFDLRESRLSISINWSLRRERRRHLISNLISF